MKRSFAIILFVTLLVIVSTSKISASDWTRVVDFEGFWNFTIGDDQQWAEPKFNNQDWDRIFVPRRWEDAYPNYNGYAWYRKNFDMRWVPDKGRLIIMLGRIDDVDEVYLNGVKIGGTGSYFPNYKTAYNIERRYPIPDGILKKENNIIAVKVFDEGGDGGIVSGNKIGIFYDNDISLLAYNLEGNWKFSTFRQQGMTDFDFNDGKWNEINVPGNWENQGYENFDGYAWYRKTFSLPAELNKQDLYLVLGKIDDLDKVYLNGEFIGRTEYLERYSRYNKSNAWRLNRVYKIPDGLLRKNNILLVEVKDYELGGGIYEGPIGLATYQNAKIIAEREDDHNYWENIIDGIFRFFYLD